MNKLLKVTLITAIMATSGMCGGDITRGPQSPIQNQCCEMMTKGALCAAAGYVAYKLYWDTSVDGNTGSLESITKEVADIKSGLAEVNDGLASKLAEVHAMLDGKAAKADIDKVHERLNKLGVIFDPERINMVKGWLNNLGVFDNNILDEMFNEIIEFLEVNK